MTAAITPPTTERLTLAQAAQDVCDSAHYETERYVKVNRLDGLEACIPEARAIEAATNALLAVVKAHREKFDGAFGLPNGPEQDALYAAADALEQLMGGAA